MMPAGVRTEAVCDAAFATIIFTALMFKTLPDLIAR